MNTYQLFKQVSTFVLDMDGVLTDGSLLIMENGLMARRMNIKDGYALQLAVKKGYRVIVISGSQSPEVALRLKNLGITDIFMKVTDKLSFLKEYVTGKELSSNSILYMGDDIPDLFCMKEVLVACCPADAAIEIKQICHYISTVNGGYGCVRDVIEKVLKLQGQWAIDSGTGSI